MIFVKLKNNVHNTFIDIPLAELDANHSIFTLIEGDSTNDAILWETLYEIDNYFTIAINQNIINNSQTRSVITRIIDGWFSENCYGIISPVDVKCDDENNPPSYCSEEVWVNFTFDYVNGDVITNIGGFHFPIKQSKVGIVFPQMASELIVPKLSTLEMIVNQLKGSKNV